ncbi:hypothetical protein BC834DRAFT_891211 [Gloeopeniophorella convolvens]|nr:hypothetical protein BC834DRAFT_891211 [Gloeopeniophorella convolvens]
MLFTSTRARPSKAGAMSTRRESTTITLMETELGICILPPPEKRFREYRLSVCYDSWSSFSYRPAIPSKLKIFPPKRKQSSTQAPEPRQRSSLLRGSWETLWDGDVEDIRQEQSPHDEIPSHAPWDDSIDDSIEPGSEPGKDILTPTGNATWGNTDEEKTPLLPGSFASQLDTQSPEESEGGTF